MNELKPCKHCGDIGLLKSDHKGNMAVVCQNPRCRLHNRGKSAFKGSEKMAIEAWNRRVNDGTERKVD